MMTTTVVDYPVAFQVPSEYDPICDARPAMGAMGASGATWGGHKNQL